MKNLIKEKVEPSLLEICDAISSFRISEEIANAGLTARDVIERNTYLRTNSKFKEEPFFGSNYLKTKNELNINKIQQKKQLKPKRYFKWKKIDHNENKISNTLSLVVRNKRFDSGSVSSNNSSRNCTSMSASQLVRDPSLIEPLQKIPIQQQPKKNRFTYSNIHFPSLESIKILKNEMTASKSEFQNFVYKKMTKSNTQLGGILVEQTQNDPLPSLHYHKKSSKRKSNISSSVANSLKVQLTNNIVNKTHEWQNFDFALTNNSPLSPNPSICTVIE